MKIKITESQLKQLIKEEANRYRRVLELEKRREEIVQQLNEMYEGDIAMEDVTFDEGAFDFVKNIFKGDSSEAKKQQMLDFVTKHPRLKDVPNFWAQKTGEAPEIILDKLVDFLAKEANIIDGQLKGVKHLAYDATTKQFVNKTISSAPYGPMSGQREV